LNLRKQNQHKRSAKDSFREEDAFTVKQAFLKALALLGMFAICITDGAAEQVPRFKSSGFLQSLDLFADQSATLQGDDQKPDRLKIDFAFRGEQMKEEPGFLYLRDESSDQTGDIAPLQSASHARPSTSFTPRLSALGGLDRGVDPNGRARTLSSFTPRYAGSEMSLSFAPRENSAPREQIRLKINSEYLLEQSPGYLAAGSGHFGSGAALSPYDRESINMGMSVGYLGFIIGASMTRESGGLLQDVDGFNIGFGYAWSAFTTQLSVGEYHLSGDVPGFETGYDRYHKLELGAAYAVSERLRVSGGVRLFDYGARFSINSDSAERSGLLYLGTRFNF
jgi:hypothetical protein